MRAVTNVLTSREIVQKEMKKFAWALMALTLIWACSNSAAENTEDSEATNSTSTADLRAEVMALHDKVMPEMTPMSKLQGQLMTASVGREDSIEIMTTATDLKYAKEAMMVWMRDFSNNFNEEWSEEEKAVFFKEEKVKMERIDAKTQEALAAGRTLMESLSAEMTTTTDSVSAE